MRRTGLNGVETRFPCEKLQTKSATWHSGDRRAAFHRSQTPHASSHMLWDCHGSVSGQPATPALSRFLRCTWMRIRAVHNLPPKNRYWNPQDYSATAYSRIRVQPHRISKSKRRLRITSGVNGDKTAQSPATSTPFEASSQTTQRIWNYT